MINLNYNYNSSGLKRALYTDQQVQQFRQFQIQYLIVAGGGGAAGGNTSFLTGSAPLIGIAGNAGTVLTGSYCVQPFTHYPITIGGGGQGGASGSINFQGLNGGDSSFYNIVATGGIGGQSQIFLTSSTAAGNGSGTSASLSYGGSGSQWTYNLPGCLPTPQNPSCHGGELISSSYYAGGGAGIVQTGAYNPLTVEYIVIGAGGGAGGGTTYGTLFNSSIADGGGGGAAITGSFILEPVKQTYRIVVGQGGAYGVNADGSNGGYSSAFGVYAQGGIGATSIKGGNSGTGSWSLVTPYIGANSKTTGAPNVYGGGGAGTAENGQSGINASSGRGGNGLLWVDGGTYSAGGGGANNSSTAGEYAPYGYQYTNLPTQYPLGLGGTGWYGGTDSGSQSGNDGGVILRYPGSGSKLTGGTLFYSSSYTYHIFQQHGTYTASLDNVPTYTSGIGGIGGGANENTSAIDNSGASAGASFFNTSGSNGGSGFLAIRYQGAPLATGGNIVVTDHYTYHLYSSSGDFYVIAQESDPNINPCP